MQNKKHGHAYKKYENSISFNNVFLVPQGMSMCIYMYICNKNRAKQIVILQKHNAHVDMPTTLKPNYFPYEKMN